MKTVITYGTFDLFHIGHVNLLKRLRALGDKLIVGCSTDEFNALKGKRSLIPYQQRVAVLESCRFVDAVFPEKSWKQKREDIVREHADIFAMGDDWVGKFDDLGDLCKVVYIPRTPDISSTEIKELVHALHRDKVHAVKAASEHLLKIIEEL